MRLSLNHIIDKAVWILTTILLTSFILFETTTWGRYIFLGITVLIACLMVIRTGGILKLKLQAYHVFFLLFMLFVLISSLWAWLPSNATDKAVTLFLIFVCASVLYMYYQDKAEIHDLLTAVMWSGYLIAVYTIFFYGVDRFGAEVETDRLNSEFANVNGIGMAVALSCVLQFNELMDKKNRWTVIMMIPAIYVIAATQSRKALIYLVGGIYAVYVLKTLTQRGAFKKVIKILGYTLVFCVGAYFLLQLPAFAGIMERMEELTSGQYANGSSVDVRNEMIQIGIRYFKKYPIGGIGIGGSYQITAQHLGWSTYLHNNFVELLSCGGIVGFLCYYSSYIYLFVNLIKYRKADSTCFTVGLVWLCITLAMHYGQVAYYSKYEWYHLMVHFLNVESLKRKAREVRYEIKEAS